MKTSYFIKQLDPELYNEYRVEVFKETGGKKVREPQKNKIVFKEPEKPVYETLFDGLMDNIRNLDPNHKAVQLVKDRMIPRERWEDIYYIDDMRKIGQLKEKYREKFKTAEDRLVIVRRDRRQQVIGVNCRSFQKECDLRYISIPISETAPQVYGYDRVDLKKEVPVLEGEFDAMFIPNSVAVGGSNLAIVEQILSKDQARLIYDYQPRNIQLVKQIKDAIDKNFWVVLLPDTGYKDINAMVQGGIKKDEILSMIRENSVRGLQAKLLFRGWKKVDC